MFSFAKSKFKFVFRVVVSRNPDRPFLVQRKTWIGWADIDSFKSKHEADADIHRRARLEYMRPGKVMSIYTEHDYLADKLKDDNR